MEVQPATRSSFAASSMNPCGAAAKACSSSELRRSIRCAITMRMNNRALVACVTKWTSISSIDLRHWVAFLSHQGLQRRRCTGCSYCTCGALWSDLPTPFTSCMTCTTSFWKCSVLPLLAAAGARCHQVQTRLHSCRMHAMLGRTMPARVDRICAAHPSRCCSLCTPSWSRVSAKDC